MDAVATYDKKYEANLAYIVKLMLTLCYKVHIINIVLPMEYIRNDIMSQ